MNTLFDTRSILQDVINYSCEKLFSVMTLYHRQSDFALLEDDLTINIRIEKIHLVLMGLRQSSLIDSKEKTGEETFRTLYSVNDRQKLAIHRLYEDSRSPLKTCT